MATEAKSIKEYHTVERARGTGASCVQSKRSSSGNLTSQQWLNALAILQSIDEVIGFDSRQNIRFRSDPVLYLQKSGNEARAQIWTEVRKRLSK